MRRLVVTLAAALVAASCSASGVSTIEANRSDGVAPANVDPRQPSDDLAWAECDGGGGGLGPSVECAALTVPLDHDRPDDETIEIALARVATADPDQRIGSLLFNPGGPGGSGIDFLTGAALLVPEALAERFDLVSFDPRGVAASTAIDCDVDVDDDVTLLAEGDDAGWLELVAEAEVASENCTAESLRLDPHVGTNNAARDLDLVREALGDEQLSYVGFSYGTRLGATYAELFPERVRALVLDGAVKPTNDLAELARDQGAGFDLAFGNFAAACDDDADCVLGAVGPTFEVYQRLVDELGADGELQTTDGQRVLTPGELQLAVVAAMYNTQLWPVLAQALLEADTEGDGTLLQTLADTYLGRELDGSYDNSQVAGFAINCADDPARPSTDVVRERADTAAGSSVWFAGFLRASTGCIGAADPIDPLVIGPAAGADPILVIGTTGDPATPYEWAVEMADALESGVLYTVEADGHTAFLSVPCVDDVVVDYLVELRLPGEGASCAADADLDVFAPPGEGELDQVVALFDCLRENGADIPEFSLGDLLRDPSGETILDAIDPTDPAFGAAVLACQGLLPDL